MITLPAGGRVYGPDRLPLAATARLTEVMWGYRPFHGILPRSLTSSPDLPIVRWPEVAPHLGECVTVEELRQVPSLVPLMGAIDEAGVLTFDQSLVLAEQAARAYAEIVGGDVAELWNVKEGHTTSVWRLTLLTKGRSSHVALNVSRDASASVELGHSAVRLREVAAASDVLPIARALYLDEVRVDDARAVVLIQEWVEDAREINSVKSSNGRQPALVERFLFDPKHPARIRGVLGARLTSDELGAFGEAVATILLCQPDLRFTLDDGDWVLGRDGFRLIACDSDRNHFDEVPEHLASLVSRLLRTTDPAACRAIERGVAQAMKTRSTT
jgi:hypothetical protein